MIMNQFTEKLKYVQLPMVGPTKNQDEKKITKLISRHAKAFKANDTEIVIKTEDLKEPIPDFASGIQLQFNSQWQLQNTTQIPKENIEKIKKEAANAYIAKSANDLLDRVNDLKLGKYDNGSFANSPGFLANYNQDTPERIQAEALNHMIRAIAAVYPN